MQRQPTTLEGATNFTANNATTTIATASANVAGVIIRTACLTITGNASAQQVRLRVDGNAVLRANGGVNSAGPYALWVTDLYIPPGVSVDIISDSVQATADVMAEVLA